MTGYNPSICPTLGTEALNLHVGDTVVVEIRSKLKIAKILTIFPDPRRPYEATNVEVCFKRPWWFGYKRQWISGYYVKGIEPKEDTNG